MYPHLGPGEGRADDPCLLYGVHATYSRTVWFTLVRVTGAGAEHVDNSLDCPSIGGADETARCWALDVQHALHGDRPHDVRVVAHEPFTIVVEIVQVVTAGEDDRTDLELMYTVAEGEVDGTAGACLDTRAALRARLAVDEVGRGNRLEEREVGCFT